MSQAFELSVVDPLIRVFRDLPFEPTGSVVEIDAVRNEYESGQVIVTAKKDLSGVKASFACSPAAYFDGALDVVRLDFIDYVPVPTNTELTGDEDLIRKAPFYVPDPFAASEAVDIRAGENRPVWLTIRTSKRAKPGVYMGQIKVAAARESASVMVRLTVHDATLPDNRTLMLTNWIHEHDIAGRYGVGFASDEYFAILEKFIANMAEHRQTVFTAPILSLIRIIRKSDGAYAFDFSKFDRWVKLFRKYGMEWIEGRHIAHRTAAGWECTEFRIRPWKVYDEQGNVVEEHPEALQDTPEAREFLALFLPALLAHLKEKGWADRYIQHVTDEPIPCNLEAFKRLSAMVKEFMPGIPRMDANMTIGLEGDLEIWCPLLDGYDHNLDYYRALQAKGEMIWFYTCLSPKGKYMNRFLDYALIKTRLLHWVNFLYDMPGYLHWGYNAWPKDPWGKEDVVDALVGKLPPGDTHIVYPGKNGPLSSIRFEALRDGVEDYELLVELAKKDEQKAKEIASNVIRSLTDYTTDSAVFRKARLELIEALERRNRFQKALDETSRRYGEVMKRLAE